MSPNRIDSMPSVSSKLITNIIFSVYRTPLTLGLYILIICTSPLYNWYSLYIWLNNIYFAIYYRRLYLLYNTILY
jgi:hypothetical protein